MTDVNNLVLAVQQKGFESYEFYELFNIIKRESVFPKVRSYSKSLYGNTEEVESEAFELLYHKVMEWGGVGSFHIYYRKGLQFLLLNKFRYINYRKRIHNYNYDLSLSESMKNGEGDMTNILEVARSRELQTEVNYLKNFGAISLDEVMALYKETCPAYYDIIQFSIDNFNAETKAGEKTKAFCEFLGVENYTKIQKRISRARESFRKFLEENNFNIICD